MPTFDNPYDLPDAGAPDATAVLLRPEFPYDKTYGQLLQSMVWNVLVHPGEQVSCCLRVTFDRPRGPVTNYCTVRLLPRAANPLGGVVGLSYANQFLGPPNLQQGERAVFVASVGNPYEDGIIAAHEIGHSAGLEHNSPAVEGNLMNGGATLANYHTTDDQRKKIHAAFAYLKKWRIGV